MEVCGFLYDFKISVCFPFWWLEGNPGMCLLSTCSIGLQISLKFFIHVLGGIFPYSVYLHTFHLWPQTTLKSC